VDLPPEEDEVLRVPAAAHGLDIIRLATPTTDAKRLQVVLSGASGFLYYVSITGVTGTKSYASDEVRAAVKRLKASSDIPCAVGFGIKTPEQAADIAGFADAAVVGSAVVSRLAPNKAKPREELVKDVLEFCAELAKSVHAARSDSVVE
jgi:tryptophan synthase alpha chain